MTKLIRGALIAMSCIMLFSLSACTNSSSQTQFVMEMEMSEGYDENQPFINEKLFTVSENVESLELSTTFELVGETATLKIFDRETEAILFEQDTWNTNVDKTNFIITLDNLEKDREYVIQLTCENIEYVKLVITSENSLIKEKEKPTASNEKPIKPNKN